MTMMPICSNFISEAADGMYYDITRIIARSSTGWLGGLLTPVAQVTLTCVEPFKMNTVHTKRALTDMHSCVIKLGDIQSEGGGSRSDVRT